MQKPFSTVIVRSHGEPKSFYDKATEKKLKVIDATCPFVARIHEIAKMAYESNKQVLIVGDSEHPEIVGINGWCNDSAVIINGVEELKKYIEEKGIDELTKKPLVTVAQTTIRKEIYEEVINKLSEMGLDIEVN